MEQYEKLTLVQSRLAFLDTCRREFTFYGASFFSCVVTADTSVLSTIGSQRLLAVTPKGIILLRSKLRSDKDQSVQFLVEQEGGDRIIDLQTSYQVRNFSLF